MKFLLLLISIALTSCAVIQPRPYACGPTLDQETIIKTFKPILEFMGVQPGETFADVGASSGYYTMMMATLMDHNTIYIQDIDTVCLNNREVNKVIDYYSKQSKRSLREHNTIQYVVGTPLHSNLPDDFFDHIYSNGTFHHFNDPDKMINDLYHKLKPNGEITIRDYFATKSEEYCEDKPRTLLYPVDSLLAVMDRNGFRLIEKRNFVPYPTLKFAKK